MGQREQQKRQTRRAIADAAREVFLAEGAEAPIELIADRAGVSKPTVFFHYGSRVNLQAAVAYDAFSAMLDHIRAAVGETGVVPLIEAALTATAAEEARLVFLVGDSLAWSAPGTTELGMNELDIEFARQLRNDGVPEHLVGDLAAVIVPAYVLTARRVALGGGPPDLVGEFVAGVRAILATVGAGQTAVVHR